MPDYGREHIEIGREDPSIRPIQGAPNGVWHFVMVTERGPVGVPTLITSWDGFKRIFGGFLYGAYYGPVSIYRAFRGRGQKRFWVTRVTHFSDVNDPATTAALAATVMLQTTAAAPSQASVTAGLAQNYDLAPNQTLRVVTDAVDTTCTFTAAAAARQNGADETFALTNGWTLTLKIDEDFGGGLQTIEFLTGEFVNIAAATAEEVAAVIAAKIVGAQVSVTAAGKRITITSDRQGNKSGVNIVGGLANGPLLFVTGLLNGTGNVADIDAVTATEVAAVVVVAGVTTSVSGGKPVLTRSVAGSTKTVQVHSASTAINIGFDNATHAGLDGTPVNTLKVEGATPGTWGNNIDVNRTAPTSGRTDEFDFVVSYKDTVKERFKNLTIGAAYASLASYCETAINGISTYISVTDQLVGIASPGDLPAIASSALISGNDGLAAYVDADLLGEAGIKAVKRIVDSVTGQCVPGETTEATVKSIIDVGETYRIFTVYDPIPAIDAAALVAAYTAAGLMEYSELATCFWAGGWTYIANPDNAVYGQDATILVPTCGGVIASMITKDSQRGGVHEAPCNTLDGRQDDVISSESDEVEDPDIQDYLASHRINTINKSLGGYYYLHGTDTGKSTGSFPSIGESRGVLAIEKALQAGLEWVTGKNLTARLYRQIKDQITLYLIGQMNDDAFATRDAATAFYVDMGATLNTASEQYAGRWYAKIALAKARPAKWGFITITKDVRAVAEEILKASA